jgi:ABC-type lipoprotein release transport system permease subunit
MRVNFVPLRQFMFQRSYLTSILLPFSSIVAAGILLVGCLNFAVVVLLREVSRTREFGIRSALGASPWRILRRVLAEGQLLVAFALTAGILIAIWAVQGVRVLAAPIIPGWIDLHLDWRISVVMALAAVAAGALFALPAARVLRGFDVQRSLRIGDGNAALSRRAMRLLDALVFGELLLAAVFLPMGMLFGVMTLRENRLNVGFNYHDLVQVDLVGRRAGGPGTSRLPLPHGMAQAARGIPGILSVSGGHIAFTNGDGPAFRTDQDQAAHADVPRIAYSSASFLRTFGVAATQGRLPTLAEEESNSPVAVLSATAALRLFPQENPIGRSIIFDDGYLGRRSLTVVGIVNDVRMDVMQARDSWATVFTLIARADSLQSTLYLRVPNFSVSRGDALKAQIERVAPGAEVARITTEEASLDRGLTQLRVTAASLLAITAVFIVLAIAGIFGTAAYSVRLRLREVGIRRALGAPDLGIVRLLAGSIGRRATLAALIGLPAGVAALTLVSNGTNPVREEPGMLVAVVVAMLFVVLAGALGPIVRGLRVSPTDILREE